MLADRLLAKADYDCDREIRTLELLKLRFGDTNLNNCEVDMGAAVMLLVVLGLHVTSNSSTDPQIPHAPFRALLSDPASPLLTLLPPKVSLL